MAFNPDLYLAKNAKKESATTQGFDPDAFLAKKAEAENLAKSSSTDAALEGFGKGLTVGYLPQLQAAIESPMTKVLDLVTGNDVSKDLPSYVERRDENIARQSKQAKDHKGLVTVMEIAGGVLSPVNRLIPGASRLKEAKKLGLLKSAYETAKVVGKGGGIAGLIANPGDKKGEISPFQVPERLLHGGLGLLFGSALGGGLGAGGKTLTKVSDVLMRKSGDIAEEASKHSDEIVSAAKSLGVTPTKGMLSKDPVVRGLESSLEQSPSLGGAFIRAQTKPAREGLQNSAEGLFEAVIPKTAREAGESIQGGVLGKIHEKSAPSVMVYEDLMNRYGAEEVSPRIIKIAQNRVMKSEASRLLNSARAKEVAETLGRAKTVKDMRTVKTLFSRALENKNLDPLERIVINEGLQAAERATEHGLLSAGKSQGKNVVKAIRDANKGYRETFDLINPLKDKLKIKAKTLPGISEEIAKSNPEDISRKLFSAKDSKFLSNFKKNFPEEFEELRVQKLAEVLQKSQGPEGLSINKFLNHWKRFTPEVQKELLDEASLSKLKNIEIVNNAFPGKIGPSGTPQGMEFLSGIPYLNKLGGMGRLLEYNLRGSKGLLSPSTGKSVQQFGKGLLNKGSDVVSRGLLTGEVLKQEGRKI